MPRRLRLVTPAVAAALLVLVTFSAVLLLHEWLTAATTAPAGEAGKALAQPLVKIDAAGTVTSHGYCVYYVLYARNVGRAPATIDPRAPGYVELAGDGRVPAATAPGLPREIPPGRAERIILAPARQHPEPSLAATLATAQGVEATIRKRCGQRTALTVALVLKPEDTKIIDLGNGVIVKAISQPYDGAGNYNVTIVINATTSNATVVYARAEIVTATGTHPLWAANPIVDFADIGVAPFSGPNYVAVYWVPITYLEFPVTVLATVYTEPPP